MVDENLNSNLQTESNTLTEEKNIETIPVYDSGKPIGGNVLTDISGVKVDFESIKNELFIPNSGEPISTSLDPTIITNANVLANALNYNPVSMNYPYDMDPNSKLFQSQEKPNSSLENLFNKYSNPAMNKQLVQGGSESLQPLKFDTKATNYDRYNAPGFKHLFNDIGFHPYVDNETVYNAQSTWFDEFARMRNQWTNVFSTGFMSTYNAIGDAFSGNYTSADNDGAVEYEEAMRIGMSSKEGGGAFLNNLMLNSGYTFGILSNIAVEELALAGLEAITLGGATPIVSSRTAYNFVRGGKAFDRTKDMNQLAKQSKALSNKLNDSSEAYQFWNAGGKWALNIITPNTYKAIKEISTTTNTAKALSLMARNAKTAGGFYRDIRSINLAMSESKLEAGMVENSLYNDLYNEHLAKFGSRPIGEDLTNIKQTVAESGFTTLMWNFPVIFFSNQIVLGTALRGFKGLGGIFNKATSSTGNRIIKKSTKDIIKSISAEGVKTAYVKGSKTALGRMFQKGISGNLLSAAATIVKYSSANLAEGFQEITQEAIAVGAYDYYKNLYNDPAMGGLDAQMASIYSGAKSQISGQGFETFMSGFLMGGLVQGPQKLVFNTLPNLYSRFNDSEAYAKYKKDEEEYIEESINILNKMYNDPETYFDQNRINAMLQKQASQDMFDSSYRGDVLSFYDQKDASIFHALYTAASLNRLGDFSKMFSDLSSMDNERLIEAMPEQSKEDIENGKTRERLNNMVKRSEEMRNSYEKLNDEIINPYDSSLFKKNSREYIEEGIRSAAFNHSKMLAMFARNNFKRALERKNTIYTELSNDPIISNIAANEIDILLSMQSLISEINLLKGEIEVAKLNYTYVNENIGTDKKADEEVVESLTVEEKIRLREKQERLIILQDIFSVLTDPNNIDEDSYFSNSELDKITDPVDRTKEKSIQEKKKKIISKLRNDILSTSAERNYEDEFVAIYSGTSNPFGEFNINNKEKFKEVVYSYFQFIAKKDNVFINTDSLDIVIDKILDSKSLGTRSEILNKAISTILNPSNLIQLSERFQPRFKQMFEENKRLIADRLKKYIDVTKKNYWLNELSAIGVYPEVNQLELYLKDNGPIPQLYYTDTGILSEDDAQYDKVSNIISTQENITQVKKETSVITKEDIEEDTDEDIYDYEENFLESDDISIDDIDVEEEKSILGDLFIKQEWINYTSNQVQNNKKHLIFEEWVKNPISKKARIKGIVIDEIYNKVYEPYLFLSRSNNKTEKIVSFDEWLIKQDSNEKVLDITNLHNLDLSDITSANKKKNFNPNTVKGKDKVTVDPSGINTTERNIKTKEGKIETIYINTDNNNKPIDNIPYATKALAIKAKNAKIKDNLKNVDFEFGGKTIKTGTILRKDGKQYVITSTPQTVISHKNLSIKEIGKKSTNIYLTPDQFNKYEIVTAENTKYDKLISKLRINEPTQINPTRDDSIKNPAERKDSAITKQQYLFRNTTPEGIDELSIRVAYGPEYANKEALNKINFSQSKQEKNPYVIKNAQEFSIEFYNSEGSFGYFQGPESVLLTNDSGVVISPLELTESDIEKYFIIPTKYNGETITIAEATKIIKTNYAQSYYIYNIFREELKKSDSGIIEKNIKNYPDLMLVLSEGSITYKADNPLIPFSELETQFVSDNTSDTIDGEKPYYILNYSRVYLKKNKEGKLIKVQGSPFTNIDLNSELFKRVEADVAKYESKYDVKDKLGKYVAFVTLPNGKSAFVPLSAPVMNPEVFNELLVEIQQEANNILENNVNKDGSLKQRIGKSDKINEKINKQLFLSAEPGIYFELSVSNDGQLFVSYTNMNIKQLTKDQIKRGIVNKRKTNGYISNTELNEFKDVTDLVSRLNSFIKPVYPKGFTLNDFKISINKDEDNDIEILKILETKFLPEIKTNFSLNLNVNPSIVSIAQITRNILNTNVKPKLEVNDNSDVLDISKEEKIGIIKSDYKNIDPKYALNVVRNIIKNNNEVDQFQQEVYDNMDPNLKVAYTMQVMSEVNENITNSDSLLNQQYQTIAFNIEETLIEFEKRYWDTRTNQIKETNTNLSNNDIIDLITKEIIDIESNPENPLNSGYLKLKEIQDEEYGKAFKITNKFDGNDIEDVETYTNWIRTNLNTEFVKLNFDIDNLQRNLIGNQMLVGQFLLHQTNLKLTGEITVGTNNPFKYHEAFHAVFRMFLTEDQIKKYLKIAKKEVLEKLRKEGKTLSDELSLMRKTHALYAELSETELKERYYEEYMSDEFEKFKMNPISTAVNTEIKSLFRRILDIILQLFNFPKNTLNSLFTDIDSGKYKNAGVQENRFTTAASKTPSTAYKASLTLGTRQIKTINKGEIYIKTVNNVMPADHQHTIIAGITSLYIRRKNNFIGVDKNIILDSAIDDFIKMYNPDRAFYKESIIWYRDNWRIIQNYYNSLIAQKSVIIEAVNQRLNDVDTSIKIDEEDLNLVEAESGNITTEQWDKLSEEIGGFASAPALIRHLFANVTIEDQDMFGNKFIGENNTEPIEVGVNYTKVYDSILKAVANQPNPIKMFQQLWIWGQGSNIQTKAVVDEIFRQTGYYELASSGELFNLNQPFTTVTSGSGIQNTLFQMFTKQFENYYVPYLLQFTDKKTGVVHIFDANSADDAHYTLTQWAESFERKRSILKVVGSKENKEAIDSLNALSQFISLNDIPKNKKFNLIDRSIEIANNIYNTTGMKFDSNYILFSLLNRLSDKQIELSVEQSILIKMTQFADPILTEDINEIILSLRRGENLFLDNQKQEDDSQAEMSQPEFFKGGVKGRLRKIAINNSYFDENVGASTFINEEGNRVYAHQRPSFHLTEISKMTTDPNYLENRLNEESFLEKNFLVNNPAFISMLESGQVTLSRQSGIKKGTLNLTLEGQLKENKGFNKANVGGTKYGSINPQEFIISLINNYTYLYNRVAPKNTELGTYTDSNNETVKFAIAPSLIRVNVTTGESIFLPINPMIENDEDGSVTLTSFAQDAFTNIIKRDVELIQKEIDPETETKDNVVGGNSNKSGERTNKGRLYQLSHNGKKLLSKVKTVKRNISIHSDPDLGEDTKAAIRSGKQKVVLATTSAAAQTQLVSDGDKGLVNFGSTNASYFIMTNRGRLNINDMSTVEVSKLIADMGPYILTEKTNNKRMYSFKLGDTIYYTYGKSVQSFFKGNESLTKFDFIDSLNDKESTIKVNTTQPSTIVEKEYTDESTGQVTLDMEILDNDPAETFEQLINEGVSFEEAWKTIDGANLIDSNLYNEINEFKQLLKELQANNKISSDVTNGLGVVIDSESGKIINDIDPNEPNELMDLYNLKYDDIDFNITQIFLNDYINTLSFNELLLGDQRFSIKDAIDAIKRVKMQYAAGKSASSIISAPQLNVNHAVNHMDMLLYEDSLYKREFDKILARDKELDSSPIERGDGLVFITTKAHRYTKFGFGELTPQIAKVIDLIEAGDNVTLDEEFFGTLDTESYQQLGAIMNSQKLVYADGQVFLKMSTFTLTPMFTSMQDAEGNYTIPIEGRENLHNLRIKLEKWEVGKDTLAMAVPMSASKMFKKNPLDNASTFDNSEIQDINMTRLNASYLRLQLVNPSNKIETVDPIQIKNLITSEQDLTATVLFNGKEMSIKDVIDLYHQAQSNKLAINWFAKRNLVFDFDKIYNEFLNPTTGKNITVNLSAFLKFAIAGLESAQSKQDMLSYFSLSTNGTGEPQFNLNNQLTRKKFQTLFLSFLSKGVLSARQPGTSLALVSDDGFNVVKKVIAVDENGTPVRWEVIRDQDWRIIKAQGNTAKRYTNEAEELHTGLNENDYYVDRLRSDVMDYDENNKPTGVKYTEFVMPAHFNSILLNLKPGEPIPAAIAKAFGIRIPSQDKHSSVNLKVVDFLPVYYGSSAIFARELVELSGADFDIDKLYTQFKEFFHDGKEFVAYGEGKTESIKYEHYIKWVINSAKTKGTPIREAVERYLESQTTPIIFNLSEWANMSNEEIIILFNSEKIVTDVMTSILGLPVSQIEYTKYKEEYKHEPYPAAIDNEILDYKYILQGNSGMTDPTDGRLKGKAYEPANIKPLSDELAAKIFGPENAGVWDYIKSELPQLAEILSQEDIDIDNLRGKLLSFKANKEGADSIGAIVSPNIVVNIAKEFQTNLRSAKDPGNNELIKRLTINDITYSDFVNYSIDPKTGKIDNQGYRTQYIISALVTAMTDNAKERLADKLGLNKKALAMVGTMTAMGVDIKTSILLINQPAIRSNFFTAVYKNDITDPGIKSLLMDRQKLLLDFFTEQNLQISDFKPKLTTEYLERKANDVYSYNIALDFNEEDINQNLLSDLAQEFLVIDQFLIVHEQTEFLRNVSVLLTLQKELGTDMFDIHEIHDSANKLGLTMSDQEWKGNVNNPNLIPFDFRPVFLKEHQTKKSFHITNYKIFDEIFNYLLPKVFLEASSDFVEIKDLMLAQMTNTRTKKDKDELSNNITSYLNTLAYLNSYKNISDKELNGAGRQTTQDSLNNNLIYESLNFGKNSTNTLTISTVLNNILRNKNGYNYFIDDFIAFNKATNEDNYSGIDKLTTNNFTQLNDAEISRIQTSFLELYSNPKTHIDSISLIHYLLVKDGFNANNKGTFISLIPAELKKSILNSIDSVQTLFNSNKSTNEAYKRVFGMTKIELKKDLVTNYLKSTSSQYQVIQIDNKPKKLNEIFTITTEDIKIKEGSKMIVPYPTNSTIIIEDNSESAGLDITAPRKFSYNNIVYYSVEHAYEVNKSGTLDKELHKKYVDKKDNIGGVSIKGKVKGNLKLLTSLTKLSFLQNLNKFIGKGDYGDMLRSSNKFDSLHLKPDVNDAYINGIKQAQKEIVYSKIMYGQNAGTYVYSTRSTIVNKISENNELRNEPIVVDVDKSVLTMKLYSGIGTVFNDKIKTLVGTNSKIQNKENSLQLNSNIKALKNIGIKVVSVPVRTSQDKIIVKKQMILPIILRKQMKDDRIVILELVKYQRDGIYERNADMNSIIPDVGSYVLGNYAEYAIREEGPLGSRDQNPIGFLFGIRPSNNDIQKFITEKNEAFEGLEAQDEIVPQIDEDNFDESDWEEDDDMTVGTALMNLQDNSSEIQLELENTAEDLIKEFYNSLTVDQKLKLPKDTQNYNDLIKLYNSYPTDVNNFIDNIKKCYI
jgi:hypothetical protein